MTTPNPTPALPLDEQIARLIDAEPWTGTFAGLNVMAGKRDAALATARQIIALFPRGQGVSHDLEAAKGMEEVLLYGQFKRDRPTAKCWVIGKWFDGWSENPADGFWTAHTLPFIPDVWAPLPDPSAQFPKGGSGEAEPTRQRVEELAELLHRERPTFKNGSWGSWSEIGGPIKEAWREYARKVFAAHPAPKDRGGEPDMRLICEALGFDPTNHHNAAKCPYCNPEPLPDPNDRGEGWREVAEALITAERRRQIEGEGWTPEHDDEHADGEMMRAGVIYLHHGTDLQPRPDRGRGRPMGWPWSGEWFKPKDRRSNLVRAGALFMAEKDRLHRGGFSNTGHVDHKLNLATEKLADLLAASPTPEDVSGAVAEVIVKLLNQLAAVLGASARFTVADRIVTSTVCQITDATAACQDVGEAERTGEADRREARLARAFGALHRLRDLTPVAARVSTLEEYRRLVVTIAEGAMVERDDV